METVPDTGLVQRKTMGDALHIPPGEGEREGERGERQRRETRRDRDTHVHRNPIDSFSNETYLY
jgi:hypothetical protein